jgi:trimeric autotransporter adhesin
VIRSKVRVFRESACTPRRSSRHAIAHGFESLESRELLATFTVTNLHAAGTGSLREAIINSNKRPGPDTIDFDLAGTIRIGRKSLPAINGPVTIDGTTAPSFAGSPVVTVNFQGSKGFRFAKGADGSILESLSLVRAGNAGVTLDASHVTIQGSYIGLLADGTTAAGNKGDGVRINASSHSDLIGQSNPVTSISYYTPPPVNGQNVSGWQGISQSGTSGQYLIAGTLGDDGLLYEGPISTQGGTNYLVNYPSATTTSVYGPDDLGNGEIRLVGSYKTGAGVVNGFLFQGTTAELSDAASYRTIDYPNAQYTYMHSTMGDLAVGNADGPEGSAPIGTGDAFIYSVSQSTIVTNIVYPGSASTTAYGVWYNGGTSYTIAGGYSLPGDPNRPISNAYLVDYNSASGEFTHWASFEYPNGVVGQDYISHFEGVSGEETGVYTIAADTAQVGSSNLTQGSWVTVRRNADGTFGDAVWVDLNYPGVTGWTSNDSVAGNQAVGIVIGTMNGQPVEFSYQATINTGFQLSNVISGNGGNGIGIYGAAGNQIAMNNVGTNAAGTAALGNARNGILVTNHAAHNLIGGQATGGNDPTANVIVRPPQGNLISGNLANGVLMNKGATQNLLSGNFVGTSASGDSAIGNKLDGAAIVHAGGNQVIGCTLQQSPFVFYNVFSGNGGNGLRVTNSNNTTVHANFMGTAADNTSTVPNGRDGLLVSGSSRNTQVGGVIPLGNVISGNIRNGIEVSGKASGFVSFNTFAGTYAFGDAAPNGRDGILVTSTGGDNLIRTCIVSGNLGNGIEIGGNASAVQITDTSIGTNSSVQTKIPNLGSGVLISGNAHGNAIGGFQPSVEPQVTISGNGRFGVEVVGRAHDNVIYHTDMGTTGEGTGNLANGLGGVYLGPGTRSTTLGGPSSELQNLIANSGGAAVTIKSSRGNAVLQNVIRSNAGGGIVVLGGRNNLIGSASAGNTIVGNGEFGVFIAGNVAGTQVGVNDISGNFSDGVMLVKAQGVMVGGSNPADGNHVAGNQGYGLFAAGDCTGSVVQGNVIVANAQGNVNLSKSSGITYFP